MKKGIIAVGILIVLAALVWFGGRKLLGTKEADTEVAEAEGADVSASDVAGTDADEADPVSEDIEAGETESVSEGEEPEESESVSGNAVQQAVSESASDEEATNDSSKNEDITEEGTLYTIKTSAGSNLGMVPVVNGNAVVLMDGGSGTTHQGEYMPEEKNALQTKVEEQKTLAASAGTISAWAFYRESSMRDFTFPEGVNAIEKFAFARSGLQSVVIPEGVTDIGYGAFYHCDALSDVTIPESVTMIEENAFTHTTWLKNWMANGAGEGDFLIVGNGILLAYRGSEEDPELPPEVKSVAPGALGSTQ